MEENKIIIQRELSIEDIKNLIYTIRGKQVMLDSDVADMYCCETKICESCSKKKYRKISRRILFSIK